MIRRFVLVALESGSKVKNEHPRKFLNDRDEESWSAPADVMLVRGGSGGIDVMP